MGRLLGCHAAREVENKYFGVWGVSRGARGISGLPYLVPFGPCETHRAYGPAPATYVLSGPAAYLKVFIS